MARSRELRVQIVGDTKSLGRSLDRTGRDLDDLGDRSRRTGEAMKTAFKGAALAAGTLAVTGLGMSVKAAMEAERSQKSLDAQLKAVGSSLRTQSAAVQDVIQKHSQLAGIDDEELQQAFGNIVRASGDVERSMKFVGLATDIARGRQMDVGKAAEIVGKVMGGNIGILSRYGFAMKDGATATEALALLQKRFGGQAKAFGDTTTGQYQRLRVSFENVAEELGTTLLPHLTNAAQWLNKFVRQMQTGKGAGGAFARELKDIASDISRIVGWVKRAINNVDDWGDATRQNVINVWRNVQRVFGNVMAGVFRGFEKLFDLGSKIPGKVGDKFDEAQRSARNAANSVDKLGERVRNLPSKKSIKIQVATLLDDFNQGKVPELFPMGSGRPTTGDLTSGLDDAVKRQAKDYFEKHATQIGPLPFLGGLGSKSPAGLAAIEAIGRKFGLVTTSGYRPGDDGWHGQNRARDISGSTSAMLAFAQYLARNFGSKLVELIHTPLGFSIDNYRRTAPFAQADHYDHVHVAMQRGGVIPGQRTGDRVPALLEEGEGIINRKAVQAMGGGAAIAAINKLVPRFQQGGTVSRWGQGISRKEMPSFVRSIFSAAGPLLGLSKRGMPDFAYGARLENAGAYAEYSPAMHQIRFSPAMMGALANPRHRDHTYALMSIFHELAHSNQDFNLSERAREGGADAWAGWAGPQILSRLGMKMSGMYPGGYPEFAGVGKRTRFWKRKQFRRPVAGIRKALDAIAARAPGGLASLNRIFPEHGLGEPGFRMSFNAVRRVFEAAGHSPRVAYMFATIAKGESGFHPGILGDDAAAGYGNTFGHGLVQITPGAAYQPGDGSALDRFIKSQGGVRALRNPFVNARAAKILYDQAGGTFRPWFGTSYLRDPGSVDSALTRGDRAWMAGGRKGPGKDKPDKPDKPKVRARRGARTTPEIKMDAWQRKVDRFDDDSDAAPSARERQALLGLGALKGHKISVINTRLRKINRALRGKLKPGTRRRLLREKANLLRDRGTLQQERRDLATRFNYKPEADTDTGGGSGSGEDPNQPLIDALNASAEAAKSHAEELKSLKDEVKKQNAIASSTVAIGLREAQRAMADMISGQIAGYAGQRARAAGDGIVGARY